MEEILEVALLGNVDHNDIEYLIFANILVDRDDYEVRRNYFNLEDFSDEEIKLNFRFERNDLPRLVRVLGIPEQIRTETGNQASGLTALYIVLRRLAYPNRLSDLTPTFGLSAQSLSQIINTTVNLIINNHGAILDNLNTLQWLNRDRMQYYAQAVSAKGAAVANCFGFIDGTARAICRPTVDQEDYYYSGHKRMHCVKYQSVVSPDGIIVSLKGAFLGRRHDAGIFRESRLYNELERKAVFENGETFVLYGDQAYGIRELLLCPYPERGINQNQQNFNNSMRLVRIAVEWGFQKVIQQFAFLDLKKNQKLLLQDVESLYKVAVILTNCHTCLYGSLTAQYFNINLPQLEEYFRG